MRKMAWLASLTIWAFALQCIVPASSDSKCTMTFDRKVGAWPLDYWQQSDGVRKRRTDTMITVSLTIYNNGSSINCGDLLLEDLEIDTKDPIEGKFNLYGNITERTEDWNGKRHTVSFKINAEDVVKHMQRPLPGNVFGLSYIPVFNNSNCTANKWCNAVNISLEYDNASVIRIERVELSSDLLGNSSVPSSVLRNGTLVTVWKENPYGILAFNLNVSDEDVYKQNPNPFEYSAITCLNATFSVLVQFCNTLDSHQNETVADADALSVDRPLGTRSASCQQLAWCAQDLKNSSEDPNRALMQYRWNVTELYSAVQQLYEQSDLSNRPFALVFVTMEVSATSGTANPLYSSQQVVWAVWQPQRLRAAVKSAAKSNVKAETPALIVVVLCVLRAVTNSYS